MVKNCNNQNTFCDAGSYCNIKNGTCTPCDCDGGKVWNKLFPIYNWYGKTEKECIDTPLKNPKNCVCPQNNTKSKAQVESEKNNYCDDPGMEGKCDNKTRFCHQGFYCKNGNCSPCVCDEGKVWDHQSRILSPAGASGNCAAGPTLTPEYCVCPSKNTLTTKQLGEYKQTYCIDPPGSNCTYGQWWDDDEKKCKDCPCEDPGYRAQPSATGSGGLQTRKLCPGNNKKAVIPNKYCVPKCVIGAWYDQDENKCKLCPCEDPGYRKNGIYNPEISDICPGSGLKENTIPNKYCVPKCKPGQWYDQDESKCKDCLCDTLGYNPNLKNTKVITDTCPGYGLEPKTIPAKACIPLCLQGYAINKKKYPNGWRPDRWEPDDGCKLCTCKNDQPPSSGATYKLPTDPQTKKAIQAEFCPGYDFTTPEGDPDLIPNSNCELNCSKPKTWPKIKRDSTGAVTNEKCDTCLCNNDSTVVGFTTPTVPACPAKDSTCNYIGKYLVCDKDDCYAYSTKPTSDQISSHSSCFFSTSSCEDNLKKPSSSQYKTSTDDAYWDCVIRNSDGESCGMFSSCYRLCSWKYPPGYSTSSNNLPSGNNNPPSGW